MAASLWSQAVCVTTCRILPNLRTWRAVGEDATERGSDRERCCLGSSTLGKGQPDVSACSGVRHFTIFAKDFGSQRTPGTYVPGVLCAD